LEFGGSIYAEDNSTIEMTSCNFEDNSAANGGAIFVTMDSSVNWDQGLLRNNYASNAGGAIHCSQNTQIRGRNLSFEDNTAFIDAGAVWMINFCSIRWDSCFFSGNRAGQHGGSHSLLQSSVWASDSTFQNNSANGVGGVFRAHIGGSGVHLDNCDLLHNDAPNGGGVVDLEQEGRVFLNRSRFIGNTSGKGGVIRMQTESTATINDCHFSTNEANYGGVVYLMYRANMDLNNVTMETNKANSDGGAIYCSDSSVSITNSSILKNNAPQQDDFYCSHIPQLTYCKVHGGNWEGFCPSVNVKAQSKLTEPMFIAAVLVTIVATLSCIFMIISCVVARRRQLPVTKRLARAPVMSLEDYDEEEAQEFISDETKE